MNALEANTCFILAQPVEIGMNPSVCKTLSTGWKKIHYQKYDVIKMF